MSNITLQGVSCSVSISNRGRGRDMLWMDTLSDPAWKFLLCLDCWIVQVENWSRERTEVVGRKKGEKEKKEHTNWVNSMTLCNKKRRKHNKVGRKLLSDFSPRHVCLWQANYPFCYHFPSFVPQIPLIVWFQQVWQLYNFDTLVRKIASLRDVRPSPHTPCISFRFSDFKII